MITGLLVENFKPFLSKWQTWCRPTKCEQGYFVPIGWEKELDKKKITYTLSKKITIKQPQL